MSDRSSSAQNVDRRRLLELETQHTAFERYMSRSLSRYKRNLEKYKQEHDEARNLVDIQASIRRIDRCLAKTDELEHIQRQYRHIMMGRH